MMFGTELTFETDDMIDFRKIADFREGGILRFQEPSWSWCPLCGIGKSCPDSGFPLLEPMWKDLANPHDLRT